MLIRKAANTKLFVWLKTKLYEKRDDFNFPTVNFPFICGNIPAYGVYISQLMQYSRASGSYQDFLDRGLLLTRKLLNQGFLLVKLKSSLRKFYGRHHDLVDHYGISVSQMTMNMFHLWYTSQSFPHSWLITGFVTRLTRRVPLVEQELLTFPEHLSSPPVFSGVRVNRSLILYICFVDRCLSFSTFSFVHCAICSFSIYGFWLLLWYLQTLLRHDPGQVHNRRKDQTTQIFGERHCALEGLIYPVQLILPLVTSYIQRQLRYHKSMLTHLCNTLRQSTRNNHNLTLYGTRDIRAVVMVLVRVCYLYLFKQSCSLHVVERYNMYWKYKTKLKALYISEINIYKLQKYNNIHLCHLYSFDSVVSSPLIKHRSEINLLTDSV